MSKKYYDPLDDLLDRPIAFNPAFKRMTGSTNAAIMLSQEFYWTKRTSNPDGWFYKTMKEWSEETGLTDDELLGARKILKDLGIHEEKLKGVPATVHYRLIKEKVYELLGFQIPEKQESSLGDLHKIPEKQESENTVNFNKESENTTKITRRKKPQSERLQEAKKRIEEQRTKRGDLFDFIAEEGSKIQMIDDMRQRVEAATGLRLIREWDKKNGDWNGYEKTLIKREVETGQTIEKFMEWFNSDEFRKTSQRIWLKPDKIELWWDEAMEWHENGKESQDRPEYKRYVPQEGNYVPKPNTPRPAALRRKD